MDASDLAATANPMTQDAYSFTTVAAATPPGVDSTTPIDTAVDVDILDPLVIVFDEAVSLVNPSGVHISAGATGVTATLGADDRTLTVTHDAFLELTQYWVTIQPGVVQDVDSNPNNQYIWSFTTEAVGAPTVVSTTPDNGATDVALDVAVSAIFDEPISEGPNFDDILIWNADTTWAPGVSASIHGDTITINFTHDPFDELTTYYP
ncbi:MAG: Ig-like domain-containing protein, partial [Chloroflexi bacterium]|nr:Ig-like domain-containing protein [Chloroflexota bacterium]